MGTPENDDPSCFWRADVEEAARRVAAVLDEERADVVTIYDPHGMYGHPDHIQVHRVGARAAELAGTPHVLQLTLNRDHVRRLLAAMELEDEPDVPDLDDPAVPFGVPEAEITTVVDVRAWIDRKRASMAAHGSQTGDTAPFLAMPDDVLADALGREWYVRHGVPAGHRDDDVFAGVAGSPDGDGTGGGAGAGGRAGAGAQVAGQARTPDQ